MWMAGEFTCVIFACIVLNTKSCFAYLFIELWARSEWQCSSCVIRHCRPGNWRLTLKVTKHLFSFFFNNRFLFFLSTFAKFIRVREWSTSERAVVLLQCHNAKRRFSRRNTHRHAVENNERFMGNACGCVHLLSQTKQVFAMMQRHSMVHRAIRPDRNIVGLIQSSDKMLKTTTAIRSPSAHESQ